MAYNKSDFTNYSIPAIQNSVQQQYLIALTQGVDLTKKENQNTIINQATSMGQQAYVNNSTSIINKKDEKSLNKDGKDYASSEIQRLTDTTHVGTIAPTNVTVDGKTYIISRSSNGTITKKESLENGNTVITTTDKHGNVKIDTYPAQTNTNGNNNSSSSDTSDSSGNNGNNTDGNNTDGNNTSTDGTNGNDNNGNPTETSPDGEQTDGNQDGENNGSDNTQGTTNNQTEAEKAEHQKQLEEAQKKVNDYNRTNFIIKSIITESAPITITNKNPSNETNNKPAVQMSDNDKKLYEYRRALIALNVDLFGNCLELNIKEINNYLQLRLSKAENERYIILPTTLENDSSYVETEKLSSDTQDKTKSESTKQEEASQTTAQENTPKPITDEDKKDNPLIAKYINEEGATITDHNVVKNKKGAVTESNITYVKDGKEYRETEKYNGTNTTTIKGVKDDTSFDITMTKNNKGKGIAGVTGIVNANNSNQVTITSADGNKKLKSLLKSNTEMSYNDVYNTIKAYKK